VFVVSVLPFRFIIESFLVADRLNKLSFVIKSNIGCIFSVR
jgi:hypothetical protein